MLVFDLETDGLLDELTRIHCIHAIDRPTGKALRFNDGVYADGSPAPRDGTIEDGVRLIQEAEEIGGHNIIPFDLRAIKKVFPWFEPTGKIRDSLAEARAIWTTLFEIDSKAAKVGKRPPEFVKKGYIGSQSLGAWGYRTGTFKTEYEGGWEHFTPEMDDYGAQDPVANVALFDLIDSKGFSPQALELENQVALIIAAQEEFGFAFDVDKAQQLVATLTGRRAELEDELRATFKPWWEPERKHGKHDVMVPKKDLKRFGYVAGAPFTKVVLQTFNPGSRQQIAERMRTLFGWRPVEFTDSGQPKVDETTLDGLDYDEAKLIVEYLTVEKRLGMLAEGKQAWLKAVRGDGRIHGRVNPNGAVTGRMTHSAPNMAQVPACGSPYGAECRELFTVPRGRKLVGCDAEGLELRMLAHYMARYDKGAYGETVVNGAKEDGTDVHTVNKTVVGLRLRDSAKTFIYAYLYGAGDFKLGTIVLDDMTEEARAAFFAKHAPGEDRDRAISRLGNRARKRIEGGLPALGRLQELVKEKARRGYVLSLDGRRLHVRSQHAALNTVLQGAGAVVMKQALVLTYRALLERGWVHGVDFGFVANVHDEFQIETSVEIAEEVGRIAAWAIAEAGRVFDLKCPLAGAYAVGSNWRETH